MPMVMGAMRAPLRNFLASLAVLAIAGAARAQTALSDLQTFATDTDAYNVIAFNSATLDNEVIGSVAVGSGGLTVTSTIQVGATSQTGSNPNLYVAGGLTLNGNTIHVENPKAYLPGLSSQKKSWSWSSNTLTYTGSTSSEDGSVIVNGAGQSGNPITSGTTPANWSSLQSGLETVSSDLATVGNNPTSYGAVAGSVSVNGQQLVLSGGSAVPGDVVVFNLTADELSNDTYGGDSFTGIDLDFSTGIDYVIDVTGLTGSSYSLLSGVNFVGSSSSFASQTLWNLEASSSTSITIGSGSDIYGSVLAPEASVTENGAINGQVLADNFSDSDCGNSSEVESDNFSVVSLPESGAFAWAAVGLCGIGFGWRHRRRLRSYRPALAPLASSVSK